MENNDKIQNLVFRYLDGIFETSEISYVNSSQVVKYNGSEIFVHKYTTYEVGCCLVIWQTLGDMFNLKRSEVWRYIKLYLSIKLGYPKMTHFVYTSYYL
jgi:hypothetical protein